MRITRETATKMVIDFPVLVLVGIATVLHGESSRASADKYKGTLEIKVSPNKNLAKCYNLKDVREVILRHHENPYYQGDSKVYRYSL